VSDDADPVDEASAGEPPSTPEDPDPPPRGLFDVFLFAPVGVALTVAEDLPGLIEKGRQRVEQEIKNARLVGKFVVTAGQKDLAQRLGQLFGGAGPGAGASDDGADGDPLEDPEAEDGAATATAATPKPTPDPADQAVVEQTFAGYDTLSASQVVRRLESLDAAQLGAVHRYEASHRNRRTILNRTQQLIGSDPVVGSDPVAAGESTTESNGSAPEPEWNRPAQP
jgi:hypothetical protein